MANRKKTQTGSHSSCLYLAAHWQIKHITRLAHSFRILYVNNAVTPLSMWASHASIPVPIYPVRS